MQGGTGVLRVDHVNAQANLAYFRSIASRMTSAAFQVLVDIEMIPNGVPVVVVSIIGVVVALQNTGTSIYESFSLL